MDKKKLFAALIAVIIIAIAVILVMSSAKKNNPAGQTGTNGQKNTGEKMAEIPKDAPQKSEVYFDAEKITAAKNQSFTVDAKVNPDSNEVTAAELHFKFDPSKLKITKIDVPKDKWNILEVAKMDNAKGTASVVVGIIPQENLALVSQPTVMATLTFQAIADGGISSIEYDSNTQIAAKGRNSNALSGSKPAQITITQTPSK